MGIYDWISLINKLSSRQVLPCELIVSVIIELTKNPNLMWFVSFFFLAITFAAWQVSQNNNKWKIVYEISKYLTAVCLLLMFFNMY